MPFAVYLSAFCVAVTVVLALVTWRASFRDWIKRRGWWVVGGIVWAGGGVAGVFTWLEKRFLVTVSRPLRTGAARRYRRWEPLNR